MKIELSDCQYTGMSISVIREPGDKALRSKPGGWAATGESTFLHHVKRKLDSMTIPYYNADTNAIEVRHVFDLVKKQMWKDGHMVDDIQQYIRTRGPLSQSPHIYLSNDHWALNGLEEDFNAGKAHLTVSFDVYDLQPNCQELLVEAMDLAAQYMNEPYSKELLAECTAYWKKYEVDYSKTFLGIEPVITTPHVADGEAITLSVQVSYLGLPDCRVVSFSHNFYVRTIQGMRGKKYPSLLHMQMSINRELVRKLRDVKILGWK
jgi:hypothetical protein